MTRVVAFAVLFALIVSGVSLGASGGPARGSSNRAAVYSLTPSNVFPPAIIGAARQGQSLAESHGTWSNSPTGYSYQWEDCNVSGQSCVPVTGATSATYTPTANDVGHTIVVRETASNAAGTSNPAASAATPLVLPAVPSNVVAPTISGNTTEGEPLTVSQGTWNNNPSSYTYLWYDCDGAGSNCTSISNATGSSYTLAGADVGHTIRVAEVAANAGGTSSVLSGATPTVQAAGAAPPTTASPSAKLTALLAAALRVHGKLGTVRQALRNDGYAMSLRTPGPGKLAIAWYLQRGKTKRVLIASATARFGGVRKVKLRIRLTPAGRRALEHVVHLKLSATATFTSSDGTTDSVTRQITLGG